MEQAEIAFTTILGSADAAKQKLDELFQFASKTPFTIPGILKSSKQLLAVGIDADTLLPTLKALGDVSAGLSVPLSRLALNFGQIKTQGKLTGRELRDFAVAGVPLAEELARMLGKTTTEIQDMVSQGAIGFPEVKKALTGFYSAAFKLILPVILFVFSSIIESVAGVIDILLRIPRGIKLILDLIATFIR